MIQLDPHNIDADKIAKAAALVDSGELVVFPTETVYGIACRVERRSLAKLDKIKGRTRGKRYTLHIGRPVDVTKYVPSIGLRAQKLIQKAWPGPLTIVFELAPHDISRLENQLDREVFASLYHDKSIGIRCPDNPVATALLVQTKHAVVAPSANVTGLAPAVTPADALEQLSGKVALVLDAGVCKYKQSSTVVKIGKRGLEILRPGAYSQADLAALSQVKFLFVCTGNTCRSPMAEGLFRKYLAEKLKCEVDQLDELGYKVVSAGTMDLGDADASSEAIAACAAKGVDITTHKSQPLSAHMVEESDLIFAMERMHRDRVVELSPEAADKCLLLAENEDIPDPIGQSQQFFRSCADWIEKAVRKRIGELVI